jgi:hypothetical protein
MNDTNEGPDVPEVIRLEDDSFLTGNFIRSDVHVAPGSGKENYGHVIRAKDGSGISGGYIDIRVSYGMPLPPEPVPEEPAQIPTTKPEKEEIRRELIKLAQQIDGLLEGNYPLSMHEASERSGLGENWNLVREWRRNHDQTLEERYNREILPQVIGTYERARVKGFFEAELEKIYNAPVIVVAQELPKLLRQAAAKP